MRQIFFAGEEPHERAALVRHVIANRAARAWDSGFERVEDRAQRHRTGDDSDLAADSRQSSQMMVEIIRECVSDTSS